MSLEKTLERIATALETIAANIGTDDTPAPAPVAEKPKKAAPKPLAAVPTPAATVDAPFKTAAELNAYVMAAYNEMGAEKGAKIANVLGAMGITNIKEITPERYGEFYEGVETLKAS